MYEPLIVFKILLVGPKGTADKEHPSLARALHFMAVSKPLGQQHAWINVTDLLEWDGTVGSGDTATSNKNVVRRMRTPTRCNSF